MVSAHSKTFFMFCFKAPPPPPDISHPPSPKPLLNLYKSRALMWDFMVHHFFLVQPHPPLTMSKGHMNGEGNCLVFGSIPVGTKAKPTRYMIVHILYVSVFQLASQEQNNQFKKCTQSVCQHWATI